MVETSRYIVKAFGLCRRSGPSPPAPRDEVRVPKVSPRSAQGQPKVSPRFALPPLLPQTPSSRAKALATVVA